MKKIILVLGLSFITVFAQAGVIYYPLDPTATEMSPLAKIIWTGIYLIVLVLCGFFFFREIVKDNNKKARPITDLPVWIAINGQSGSGKGTVAEIVERLLKKAGIQIVVMSSGEQIRNCISSGRYIGKNMAKANNKGKLQPAVVSFAFGFKTIDEETTEHSVIIQEGSPRSVEQLNYMLSIIPDLIPRLMIIEVIADEERCKQRLIQRTKTDKRLDLSKDGEPGVPDMVKIATKMNWWTRARKKIMRRVKKADVYYSVTNNGNLEDLELQIKKILFG